VPKVPRPASLALRQSRLLRERTHPQRMSLAFWRSLETLASPSNSPLNAGRVRVVLMIQTQTMPTIVLPDP